MITSMNHYTVNTTHNRVSHRNEIPPTVIQLLSGYVQKLIDSPNDKLQIPAQAIDLKKYSCRAREVKTDSIIIDLFRFEALQLSITMTLNDFSVGFEGVKAPYCSVFLYPEFSLNFIEMDWVGDFERCMFWAWVSLIENYNNN
jgi:hypothetical protein